jgi:ABC-type nitrate/sulfonate/bicarbonate transport system substrate-binding protein
MNRFLSRTMTRVTVLTLAGLMLQLSASAGQTSGQKEVPLVPIKVAGARWIELSPVVVAAESFYPQKLTVPSGGVVSITSGAADLATNAETQLLRESVNNPDLRIIMTVSESHYRLVARRSAGISKLADLKGKRALAPANTSAMYYLVAMLRSAGLKEEDVILVNQPSVQAPAGQAAPAAEPSKFRMADALARGEADVIASFEPEPEVAARKLGNNAIVLQDRKVYREAFNLHARATDLADPEKRRSIVAFVRAVAEASKALKKDPKPYLPHISSVIGFSPEEISWGWPETEFPVEIIPDMLDVLVTEEAWVAKISNRAPRSREELAQFIDRSVVKEALGK